MTPDPGLGALYRRVTAGRLTPWVKQIPTVVAYLAALVVMLSTRMPMRPASLLIAALAIVAAGTAASLLVPWRRLDQRWSVLIPVATFVSIGLLRVATGGSASPYGALLIIPVIWIAAEDGPWNPLIAGIGTCFALLLPAYLDPAQASLADIARDFLAPFVYILAAVIINEVARRLRLAGEESAQQKDEFLGLVSHELRNPLTSVLGYLQLMRIDPSPLTESQLGYIDIAERNARRLQHLVGDLLFTAQVAGGAFPLEKTRVDLAQVVAQSLASAQPGADAEGVTLVSDSENVMLAADAERLGQAIDNLVSNAVKFTPAGGTVTVRTRRDGEDALITVSDTGIGIPADELVHLSERFYRASTARNAAIPGVGLGLTVVRSIVAAHGGTMDVDSTPGEGTAFTLRLPLSA